MEDYWIVYTVVDAVDTNIEHVNTRPMAEISIFIALELLLTLMISVSEGFSCFLI